MAREETRAKSNMKNEMTRDERQQQYPKKKEVGLEGQERRRQEK
jgi:hypothetical protein